MTTITLRNTKGTPLTNTELDANFSNLNTDKAELASPIFTGNISFPPNFLIRKENTTGEGGQFYMEKSNTSTLAANVALDIIGNNFRIFENGGTSRGVILDLAAQAAGVTSKIITSASLATGVETFLATPTSANLIAAVTNETGSGSLVFNTSPTLVTPVLGAASATSLSATGEVAAGGSVRGNQGLKASNFVQPLYQANIDFGGDVPNTWRKLLTVSFPDVVYTAAVFKIDIVDSNLNFGTSASAITPDLETYYVACTRSDGLTLNSPDNCTVRGPGNRIRAVKVSAGNYEVQIQNEALYREYLVTAQCYSQNENHTVNFDAGQSYGSVGIASYVASVGTSTAWFEKLTATNQITSTVATGTAPLLVASTTAVINLNADLLDGQHGSYYAPINAPVFTGISRMPGLYIGEDTDIYLYENATNAFTIRTGAVGSEKYFTFDPTGNFKILAGTLEVSSTTKVTNLNADLLDGIDSASFLRSNTGTAFSGGVLQVTVPAGSLGTSASSVNTLQIFQATLNTDAFQTFHVSGDYAVHFGLDGTTNDLFVGGWSMGAVKNKIYHAGNFVAGTAYLTPTGSAASLTSFPTLNQNTTGTAGSTPLVSSDSSMLYGRSGLQYFNISSAGGDVASTTNAPDANWWHVIRGNHGNATGYYTDLALPMTSAGNIRYRRISGGFSSGWITVLDSTNYNNYSPTLTGTGASGNWGISVTGNAATATTVTGTQLGNTTHGLSGFAAAADWSKPSGYQTMITVSGTNTLGLPAGHGQSYFGYNVTSRRDGNGGYSATLTSFDNSNIYFTYNPDGTAYPTWRKILHESNFVAGTNYQAPLVSGSNIKTINGESLLGFTDITITSGVTSVNGLTGAVTLSTISNYTYDNRGTLRGLSPVEGTHASVDGLGIFIWKAITGILDDDETAFVTATGTWELLATSPDYVYAALAEPSNLGKATVDGTNPVGFKNIPQIVKSSDYILGLEDAGKHILHPEYANSIITIYIPSNNVVPYPIGTTITFINQNSAGVMTISIFTDIMRLSPSGTTGNRSLAANGIATAIKIGTNEWIISGTGLL